MGDADKIYQILSINGKIIVFFADEVESDEERHVFYLDGEVIGEFERRNIAGYVAQPFEAIDGEEE